MTRGLRVAVAPNFHLPDAPAVRLLLADGSGWRSLSESEQSEIVAPNAAPDQLCDLILLFALPGHLRSSFWAMLEQAKTDEGFDAVPTMTMTLTCDHRAIDGAVGADFLRTVKQLVESPALAL